MEGTGSREKNALGQISVSTVHDVSLYPPPFSFHADRSLLPMAGTGQELLLLSSMTAIMQITY